MVVDVLGSRESILPLSGFGLGSFLVNILDVLEICVTLAAYRRQGVGQRRMEFANIARYVGGMSWSR